MRHRSARSKIEFKIRRFISTAEKNMPLAWMNGNVREQIFWICFDVRNEKKQNYEGASSYVKEINTGLCGGCQSSALLELGGQRSVLPIAGKEVVCDKISTHASFFCVKFDVTQVFIERHLTGLSSNNDELRTLDLYTCFFLYLSAFRKTFMQKASCLNRFGRRVLVIFASPRASFGDRAKAAGRQIENAKRICAINLLLHGKRHEGRRVGCAL